jgi:ubiquinone/menaquinone biosynthesis C-methylase UbiE
VTASRFSDPEYLRNEQYRDASNLNARTELHVRFRTNKTQSWFGWLFDHYQVPPDARLLELGSGPGRLWVHNLNRIPAGWTIALSDFSPGMVAEQRQNLGASGRFTFEVIDAQSIPYPDGTFDAVIANHMLYHVPDRPKALAEIRRVLKPGGRLYAATNGSTHLREIPDLVRRSRLDLPERMGNCSPFTLDNGAEQLAPFFAEVQMERFPNALAVTEAEPLAAYILSTSEKVDPAPLIAFLREELARTGGVITITTDGGLFVVTRE